MKRLYEAQKQRDTRAIYIALSCTDFFPNDEHQAASVGLRLGLVSVLVVFAIC